MRDDRLTVKSVPSRPGRTQSIAVVATTIVAILVAAPPEGKSRAR